MLAGVGHISAPVACQPRPRAFSDIDQMPRRYLQNAAGDSLLATKLASDYATEVTARQLATQDSAAANHDFAAANRDPAAANRDFAAANHGSAAANHDSADANHEGLPLGDLATDAPHQRHLRDPRRTASFVAPSASRELHTVEGCRAAGSERRWQSALPGMPTAPRANSAFYHGGSTAAAEIIAGASPSEAQSPPWLEDPRRPRDDSQHGAAATNA
ncbi:hypothetical protein CYMTET_19084 [Cymbomonas tetramitiformis]|uniref:Uncharacterized protein n=1 Tax=Cymbomonas tetramitiformis TaxID=36881 RepID=A0AAE0G6Q3_9CHLO|nr:hypothetical protein CYMTET_19084 [Cymbomonas tetramitiformis]